MAFETEIYNSFHLAEMEKRVEDLKDVIYIALEISKAISIIISLVPKTVCNKLECIMRCMKKSLEEIYIILIDISDNLEDMSLTQQIKIATKFSSDMRITESIQIDITDTMDIIVIEINKVKNAMSSIPNFDVLERALIVMNDKILAMKYSIIAMRSNLRLTSM